ncbi:hypothetical protein E2C01_092900 [Portunus trituberculatus]|uniref:Uncharacterized protein n=1 Tax=Portunus trituberculatus TaxID=210409 RepID=A0A5B7JLH7_PORTR|nr:hypothetical protein [Portunus trituberculatus]
MITGPPPPPPSPPAASSLPCLTLFAPRTRRPHVSSTGSAWTENNSHRASIKIILKIIFLSRSTKQMTQWFSFCSSHTEFRAVDLTLRNRLTPPHSWRADGPLTRVTLMIRRG